MGTEVVEIHRSRQADNYTIIPNYIIRDVRLSRFARHVLIEILSNTADWHATADDMWAQGVQQCPGVPGEGRDAYRRAFRQMQAAGYLVRTKVQGQGGKWTTYLHFYDVPQVSPGGTGDGQPVAGPTCEDDVSAGHAGDWHSAPGATSGDDIPAGGAGDWHSAEAPPDSGDPPGDPGAENQRSAPEDQASSKRTKTSRTPNGVREGECEGEEPARPRRDLNEDRDDVMRLCVHLADRIEASGEPRPAIVQKWLSAARLMLDTDGRREDQVHKAIDWAFDDGFWCSNVLSMPKLRKQYGQMRIQAANRGHSTGANAGGHAPRASGPDRARGWMAAGRAFAESAEQTEMEASA